MANILILLGGQYHDFDGFANAIRRMLGDVGNNIDITYDFKTLTRISNLNYDLLLSYTCLTKAPAGKISNTPVKFNDDQVDALANWVRKGGAWLAAHAATVAGESISAYEELIGGAFIRHPPLLTFTAIPLAARHPITDGIGAFDVFDELYIQRYHSTVTFHMIAIYEQTAYPIVWSKSEGLGRVVHIELGHSNHTWEQKPYQSLILQATQWLLQ